jgi:hypothetical protein
MILLVGGSCTTLAFLASNPPERPSLGLTMRMVIAVITTPAPRSRRLDRGPLQHWHPENSLQTTSRPPPIEDILELSWPQRSNSKRRKSSAKEATCGISKSGGSPTAYLYFASKIHPGKLAAIKVREVTHLVSQYSIPVIVLNSCESTKPGKGKEADMAAQLFSPASVRGILAMSFKVYRSTAIIFLHHLYHNLVILEDKFSLAASKARSALKSNDVRPARFGMDRSVKDWIVPVTYVGEKDPQFCGPIEHGASQAPLDPVKRFEAEDMDLLSRQLVLGREFEILRLERMVIQSRLLCLTGHAGVGKTVFIKHLLHTWDLTNYTKEQVYVDLTAGIDVIGPLRKLLEHITANSLGKDPDVLEALRDVAFSYCEGTIPDSLIHRLKEDVSFSERIIFVFDGLDSSHSPMYEMSGRGRLPLCLQLGITRVIKALQSLAQTNENIEIVLVGRNTEQDWWRRHDLPDQNLFHLPGLAVVDGISYGRQILLQKGVDTKSWRQREIDIMESLARILQGNPLALSAVLTHALSQGITWNELYERVHFGRLNITECDIPTTSRFITRDLNLAMVEKLKVAPTISKLALYG